MSVHVETFGDGPPLVLLHGWAMHSGLWMPVQSRLAERFRVHLVDLPGHGFSAPVRPYALDRITTLIAQALAHLAQPPIVLGWSLGGTIAMQWALSEPDRVAGLVLVGTTPCFVARPDWPHAMDEESLQWFGDELSVSYKFTLQRFVTLQVQGSENARAVLAQLRAHLFARGEPSHEALRDALDLLATTDLRGQLGAIRQPALIIAGDRDTLSPAAGGEWLAQALPAGRLVKIAGAAHAPFLSHPDAFVGALEEFAFGR